MTLIPAILVQTREQLESLLASMRGVVREVQVDVVDGVFASSKTWPYAEHAIDNHKPITQKYELPCADEFEIEIDLMTQEPAESAESWQRAGAKRIVIHVDSVGARQALLTLQFARAEHKHPEGLQVGVGLPCTVPSDVLHEFENLYDYVQVMGIEKVGFQGQPFDERAVGLVRSLRQQFSDLPIQVDGGVNEITIPDLVREGATHLIIGSAMWKNENPIEAFQKLKLLADSV